MTQITVTSVETKQSKDGTKTFYQVWDNVLSYSTFDSEILNLRPGDIIEATVELVKGKYKNITAYKVLPRTEPPAQPRQQASAPSGSLPLTVSAELDSKARNTALMQACEFVKGKNMTPDEILAVADKFYRWLKGEALKTENPTTDTTKGINKPPSVSSKARTTPYAQTPAGKSELVSDFVRKGIPLADIYSLLGIKTPAEIIDIDEAVKVLEAHKTK